MAKSNNRDDFTPKTKLQIAKRAGWLCSDPECLRPTVGASSLGEGEIMLGEASHICAAAAGGPRFDPGMSEADRRSVRNGIWMCKLHGRAIDLGDPKFTIELLRFWKKQAEESSNRRVLYNDVSQPYKVSKVELSLRLREAASTDLEAFRRSDKWPSTNVSLTMHMAELNKPFPTSTVARALGKLGDLILIAPPGTGKTSTMLQIAEGALKQGGTPLFIPLADWATEDISLLESILRRPPFRDKISEDDFRTLAQEPGVYLLLDGWNELASSARRRARAELKRLQADLPELGLFISTRRQSLDVPFEGSLIELQPLNETQQKEIATVLRGDVGERMIDEARRTPGVRELITVPLYLVTLLSLPDKQPFPRTKEEILSRFVQAHEQQADHAESLREGVRDLQAEFLTGLAVTATQAAITSLSDRDARHSVVQTNNALIDEGQVTHKLEVMEVLDALVSHHVLVRTGPPGGYSFHHQQFQEWYASKDVEHVMLECLENKSALQKLQVQILNSIRWEEPILFAIERAAGGNERQQKACGAAILAAIEIDPILAAEMIFRATEKVWAQIAQDIHKLIKHWHTPGKLDRAIRFMITSGRSEFRDLVWPLITNENSQKSIPALRAARRFRPSILGPNALTEILALPFEIRKTVVSEIVHSSGMDGLDLAALIGKNDPSPEMKAAIIGGMSFRHANRHIIEILTTAGDKTFDLNYRKGYLEKI